MLGCEITERLHHGPRSVLLRARGFSARAPEGAARLSARAPEGAVRLGDDMPVVLKLRSTQTGATDALQREAGLLARLAGAPGIVACFGLLRDAHDTALVLEDFGATSLDKLGRAGRYSMHEFVQLALALTRTLAQVHVRGVVHNDLEPANILIRVSDQTLKLADFARATSLVSHDANDDEVGSWGARDADPRGHPAYRQTERDGTLPGPADPRSDYYALGVVLYEQVTGHLPFASADPLELAHAHATKQPDDPQSLHAALPLALSRVLLKLLAKDPDRRYQSGASLLRDLTRCASELASGHLDFEFAPGEGDRSERLVFSSCLYGRESLLIGLDAKVVAGFSAGACAVVTLEGPLGVGKSAIADALGSAAASRGDWLSVVEFADEPGQAPYAALGRLLSGLARQMLSEGRTALARWRRDILDALPDTAGVLVELSPAFATVLGEPLAAASPAVSPDQARARLYHAFGTLLSLLATPARPLCLVLEDAHAADPDSRAVVLDAVRALRDRPALLLITARTEDPGFLPLAASLEELRADSILVERQAVEPLDLHALTAILCDALGVPESAVSELAQLVLKQTGGNPFFVRSFIEALHAEGALRRTEAGVHCELENIRSRGATANVAALLLERISLLTELSQRALSHAAVLGLEFDCDTFRAVSGDPESTLALWPALQAELLVCPSRPLTLQELEAAGADVRLRFAHERVHKAALSLLVPTVQERLHTRAGRQLLRRAGTPARGALLFEALSHLNLTAASCDGPYARAELASLDLDAARDAFARGATADAARFAAAGLSVLDARSWTDDYELTRELSLLAAEAAFLSADAARVEALCTVVQQQARTPLDRAQALRLRGRALQTQARGEQAIALFLDALLALDIELDAQPTAQTSVETLRRAADALRNYTLEDLLAVPTCRDPSRALIMDLLSRLVFFSYSTSHPLLPIVVCRMVHLSLEHGMAPESANGFTFYGLLAARRHDLPTAVHFGRLALALAERLAHAGVLSQTHLYANLLLMHWGTPLSELAEAFRVAHRHAVQAGSPGNLACAITTLSMCRFWAGASLPGLYVEMEAQRATITRHRQRIVLNWHEVLLQVVRNLRAQDGCTPAVLAGPVYDERERVPVHRALNDHSAQFNTLVAKLVLVVLFRETAIGLTTADALRPYRDSFGAALWAVPIVYLECLARLASARDAQAVARDQQLDEVEVLCRRLRLWAPHCPRSVDHRLRIVEAEAATVREDFRTAARLFSEAIDLSVRAGIVQDIAVAQELAARNAERAKDLVEARLHMRGAQRAYHRWGALAKVRALEQQHPTLLPLPVTQASAGGVDTDDPWALDSLDLVSVLHATRAIAGEIKLDALLARLMSLLIQTAGANTGYLLLDFEGEWRVEAAASAGGEIVLSEPLALEHLAARGLPTIDLSILSYVAETGEALLFDPRARGLSRPRPIERGEAGSVVCFALKRQGSVRAIAYLENELARGGIAQGRLQLLEILSTQAVVSLDNARVYANLEDKVAARTRELQTKNGELAQAMTRLIDTQRKLVTQEKLAALGALTAGIAHEIKNPLNFVVNFAELAEELVGDIRAALEPTVMTRAVGDDLGSLTQSIQKIRQHSTRAAAIVNDMGAHARAGRDSHVRTNVGALLAACVDKANAAGGSGHATRVALRCEDASIEVELVAADMERVIECLLTNARHAVEDASLARGSSFEPKIEVRARDLGDRLEISVIDNGVGVPEHLLERIFSPFVTTKTAGRGTGLGLSISHDIVVRVHGGDLRVESVPGEPTHFVVELPKQAALPEAPDTQRLEAPSGLEARCPPSTTRVAPPIRS